jgi:hypothetical protein
LKVPKTRDSGTFVQWLDTCFQRAKPEGETDEDRGTGSALKSPMSFRWSSRREARWLFVLAVLIPLIAVAFAIVLPMLMRLAFRPVSVR